MKIGKSLLFCLSYFAFSGLYAQKNNDFLADSLLQNWLLRYGNSCKSVSGVPSTSFRIDSLSPRKLNFGALQIRYQKKGKNYQRELILPCVEVIGDSVYTRSISYQDSLSASALRKVRQESKPPHKGENPLPEALWAIPVSVIVGGTAAIFALFYVRSR